MADRRLRYSVEVDLETKDFLAQVNAAVSALNQIGSSSLSTLPTQLKEASLAALELSTNLSKSVDQETGKFDLLTFRKNLQLTGTDLETYAKKLDALGVSGQDAFGQVARVITSAELPLRRANGLLDSLWTTMQNTMKWQLTTSALHSFIGSIQTAFGYAQDLNESLTSIQIVTGKSTQEMAEFASQANQAAKALSTTTTNYADSSLIYFQQGTIGERFFIIPWTEANKFRETKFII